MNERYQLVFSTYLLVSIQTSNWQSQHLNQAQSRVDDLSDQALLINQFQQHPWWNCSLNWKSPLNNLRLIIQPQIFYCLIRPWLQVFKIPGFRRSFLELIHLLNGFRTVKLLRI